MASRSPEAKERELLYNRKRARDKRAKDRAIREAAKLAEATTDREATPDPVPEPPITPDRAADLVKLLHAGLPLPHAMAYVGGSYWKALTALERNRWARTWADSPAVLAATTRYLKSSWQDLSKDDRLAVALDKHCAELAYFLYTHHYEALEGEGLAKAKDARTALMEMLKLGRGGDEGPFAQMVKDLLAGQVASDKPRLTTFPADPVTVTFDKS